MHDPLDQPLYVIGKSIQWKYPDTYGRFVLMMGPLHIEMALMGAIGNWLEDSGWASIITNSGVARPGIAQSILTGHDVAKGKYAHQVTAASLHILRRKAFDDQSENGRIESFTEWCEVMQKNNPNFQYWTVVLKLDIILFLFCDQSVPETSIYIKLR